MQNKPVGWPVEAEIEVLPDLYLEMHQSEWPPGRDGVPDGTASVAAWSVDRQLQGSSLPGQIRGTLGFSIASGSVTFAQPEGAPLSPWARGPRLLGPGGRCTLYATHQPPSTLTGLKLGAFVVAPIRGANISNTVGLDIDEDSIRLKRPFRLDWSFDGSSNANLDAAWVLSEIARTAGYHAVPTDTVETVLSLPLVGGPAPRIGSLASAPTTRWSSVEGHIGLGPGSTLTAAVADSTARLVRVTLSCVVSKTGGMITFAGVTFDIQSGQVLVKDSTGLRATLPITDSPEAWHQLELSVRRTTSLSLEVWMRSPGEEWGTSTMVTMGATLPAYLLRDGDTVLVETTGAHNGGPTGSRWIRALRVYPHDPAQAFVPFTPTACLEASGSLLNGVFGVAEASAWSVAQDIARATMGAVWISEDGIFTYRARAALRGAGGYGESIEALDSLESLDWTIDPGDIADRVEYTYIPTDVMRSNEAITLWEASEPIRVAAGQKVSITADITGTTDRFSPFIPIWKPSDKDTPVYFTERMSRWAASTSAEGAGERPADNSIRISVEQLSPSKVRIHLTNTTTTQLWMVDGNGSPCLILRTSLLVTPGEPVMISAGASEAVAVNPLSVDAGAWVQDEVTASSMLGWISGQTSRAQATIDQVRVKPDLGRQLGDVFRITDEITGLRSKAIITGVSLAGTNSGYTQLLDIALLDLIFEDFDTWCRQNRIDTFQQLDDWLATNNIVTFQQFDDWLIDFGGTL